MHFYDLRRPADVHIMRAAFHQHLGAWDLAVGPGDGNWPAAGRLDDALSVTVDRDGLVLFVALDGSTRAVRPARWAWDDDADRFIFATDPTGVTGWAVDPTGDEAIAAARARLSPEGVGRIALALAEHRRRARRDCSVPDWDRPVQRYRVALQLFYDADWTLHPDCWLVEDAAGTGTFLWNPEMETRRRAFEEGYRLDAPGLVTWLVEENSRCGSWARSELVTTTAVSPERAVEQVREGILDLVEVG